MKKKNQNRSTHQTHMKPKPNQTHQIHMKPKPNQTHHHRVSISNPLSINPSTTTEFPNQETKTLDLHKTKLHERKREEAKDFFFFFILCGYWERSEIIKTKKQKQINKQTNKNKNKNTIVVSTPKNQLAFKIICYSIFSF